MSENNPTFSLVVVYRDREISRVNRFLESVNWQTNQDFELIFVDYGTAPELQKEVQKLVASYDYARYVYTESRGLLWNRSRALNLGINHTKGEYIATLDIDLILAPDYIETTYQNLKLNYFIQYSCFYLPQKFTSYDKLFIPKFSPDKKFKTTVKSTAYGIITFKKDVLIQSGLYDETYQLWGFEDINFVNRLQKLAHQKKLYLPQIRLYHQWHPKTQPTLPKGWVEQVQEYHKTAIENEKIVIQQVPKVLSKSERPTLKLLLKLSQEAEHFQFTFPKEQSFARFCYQFEKLHSGESLIVYQKFDFITRCQESKWGRLFNWINQMLAKLGVSYRWINLAQYTTELILKEEIQNFLFYFIINWENKIADYYYDVVSYQNGVLVIFIKK